MLIMLSISAMKAWSVFFERYMGRDFFVCVMFQAADTHLPSRPIQGLL